MPNVPTLGGGASTPLDAGDRPVQPLQEGLARNSQAFCLASQGSTGYAYRLDRAIFLFTLQPGTQSAARSGRRAPQLSSIM